MSVVVICHGCGQSFSTGPDYRRNKIQCPGCGVICPVPVGADSKRAPQPSAAGGSRPAHRGVEDSAPATREGAGKLEDEALDLLNDSAPTEAVPPPPKVPASPFDDAPASRKGNRPAEPPAKPARVTFPYLCRRCRRPVRRQGECPDCDGVPEPDSGPLRMDEPAPPSERGPGLPNLSLDDDTPRPTALLDDDEEDSSPYETAEGELPLCPKCRKAMTEEAVVCLACGFDLRKRKKLVKTYEPMARSWETTLSLQRRLIYFGIAMGGTLLLGGIATFDAVEAAGPFFYSWLFFGALMAFILGTFERIELTRNRKGRVTITQTWRYFFIPTQPRSHPVRGYGSISTGQMSDVGFWEWLIFAGLLFGVISALLWWYFVIHKLSYFVALTQDHGHPALYVYRGRSEEQMRDIRDALCSATGLPLEN
jgi:hypothetical protein